ALELLLGILARDARLLATFVDLGGGPEGPDARIDRREQGVDEVVLEREGRPVAEAVHACDFSNGRATRIPPKTQVRPGQGGGTRPTLRDRSPVAIRNERGRRGSRRSADFPVAHGSQRTRLVQAALARHRPQVDLADIVATA